jgi:hypothetical protein
MFPQPLPPSLCINRTAHQKSVQSIAQRRFCSCNRLHNLDARIAYYRARHTSAYAADIAGRLGGGEVLASDPLDVSMLSGIIGAIPDDLAGKRDQALLLVGFFCALRRSAEQAWPREVHLQIKRVRGLEGLALLRPARSKHGRSRQSNRATGAASALSGA